VRSSAVWTKPWTTCCSHAVSQRLAQPPGEPPEQGTRFRSMQSLTGIGPDRRWPTR